MRIAGAWRLCDDGVIRPEIFMSVTGSTGTKVDEWFLIDSGADRTVFSATLLSRLGGTTSSAPDGTALAGVGGMQAFVLVSAVLNLRRQDGGIATVQGDFAAFTDPTATDLSILGRDVLDHFDMVLSRRREEIFLLAPPSRYEIHSS